MDFAQADQSLYRPLDASKSEVRVLRLHQGPEDEEIRCTLETVSLDDQPEFHALSYVWGSGTERQINVDGHVMPVTANLATVLEHFRRHHHKFLMLHSLPIWIDAICINQADPKERVQQVRLMGRIYRQAAHVLLWIGEGDEFSDHAIDQMVDATFRDSCEELRTTSRMPTVDELRVAIITIQNLEQRRYWTRVWILQEVVLATQNPLIICGSRKMLWSWYINCKMTLPLERRVYPSLTSEWDAIRATIPVHQDYDGRFFGSLKHTIMRSNFQESGFMMSASALYFGFKLDTTDPRDHVYGVMGLMQAGEVPMPDIDYEKSPEQVLRDMMSALLTSGKPGLFSYIIPEFTSVVGTSENLEVPSWVPDLSSKAKNGPHGDNITWLKDEKKAWRPQRQAAISIEGNVLTVRAIKFDTIAETVAVNVDNKVSTTFHRGKGPDEMDIEPLRHIEDMIHGGRSIPIPPSSRLAPFLALRDKVPIWSALTSWRDHTYPFSENADNGWLPGVERDKAKLWEILLDRQPIPEAWKSACPPHLQSDPPALEAAVLYPLLNALWKKVARNNRVFVSRSGFLGVGTKLVGAGDTIAFIAGMSCMYVLRVFGDGYRIVGFADLPGLTDFDDLDEAMKAATLHEEEIKIY